MADLKVNIKGLSLKNPVLTASGTFGYGEEFADFVDLNRLGGIIVKGTTVSHREGNPYPRMVETPSGMLNAVGLQNHGVNYFINNIYPRIKDLDTEIIVNVSGAKVEDYVAVCDRLAPLDKIHAMEHLQENGIKIAVASNKYDAAAKALVTTLFPSISFAAIEGQKEGVPVKPDPSVVFEILGATQVKKADVLYVGDSGVDMETARRACVDSVGVTWGFRSVDELRANYANHIVDTPEEIIPLLD